MASRIDRISRSAKTGEFTVGAKASAKITKVEGMTLSKDMRTTFNDFDRKGVSTNARREKLVEKYGKRASQF